MANSAICPSTSEFPPGKGGSRGLSHGSQQIGDLLVLVRRFTIGFNATFDHFLDRFLRLIDLGVQSAVDLFPRGIVCCLVGGPLFLNVVDNLLVLSEFGIKLSF